MPIPQGYRPEPAVWLYHPYHILRDRRVVLSRIKQHGLSCAFLIEIEIAIAIEIAMPDDPDPDPDTDCGFVRES